MKKEKYNCFVTNKSYYLTITLLTIIGLIVFLFLIYALANLLIYLKIVNLETFFSSDFSIIIIFTSVAIIGFLTGFIFLTIFNVLSLKSLKVKLYAKYIEIIINDKIIKIEKDKIKNVIFKENSSRERATLKVITKGDTLIFKSPIFPRSDKATLETIYKKLK
ncbi:hypothetical protein LJB88_03460 [Erysipelotrichaceae bacterium OttesenSCG-928-M19]|nr:hypothetical protein [Erysipelotrichaceae bacterium OttesenSCG-928-M19]